MIILTNENTNMVMAQFTRLNGFSDDKIIPIPLAANLKTDALFYIKIGKNDFFNFIHNDTKYSIENLDNKAMLIPIFSGFLLYDAGKVTINSK